MKYRSLTYRYIFRSIIVWHWPIIPSLTVIHQTVFKTLGKKHSTVKYRSLWPSSHDTKDCVIHVWMTDVWPYVLRRGKHKRQVAQRATIAHLSPMCPGQISFQKTYKWAMETRGPKLNSSELLCLSWLSATLMMVRSKMNEPAWRHHFPIISLWEIF